MEAINRVVSIYGQQSGKALIDATHKEMPWRESYSRCPSSCITLESMRTYFGEMRNPDQDWFWDEEWQSGEEEATADIVEGNITRYDNAEDFLNSL